MDQQLIQNIEERLKGVEFNINSLQIEVESLAIRNDRLRMRLDFLRKLKHGCEEVLEGLHGLDTEPVTTGVSHAA